MIAKSDITILALASALLAFGLFRAYGNSPQNLVVSKNTTISKATRQPRETVVSSSTAPTSARVTNEATAVSENSALADTDDSAIVEIATNDPVTEVQPGLNKSDLEGATVIVEASTVIDQTNPPDEAEGVLLMVHTVRSGEYLSLLAQRYDTTVETLQELNGISGTTIQIGQDLIYPAAR